MPLSTTAVASPLAALRAARIARRARTAAGHVDGGFVVIPAPVGVDGGLGFAPGPAAVGRLAELEVEFARPVILPRRLEMAVAAVAGDARKVVGAHVRARDALLGATTEIASRLTRDDVVAHLAGRPAVPSLGPTATKCRKRKPRADQPAMGILRALHALGARRVRGCVR
jgi:hypothetical protein